MSGTFPPRVVAAGEGKTVMLFGVRLGYKVVGEDSGGRLAVLEVEIPAKTLVKPRAHTREDESSLVLSGTVGVRTGDRVSEAGPGAYLVKPRGVPTGSKTWSEPTASSSDVVASQALLQQRESLGGELADIGRELTEAFA